MLNSPAFLNLQTPPLSSLQMGEYPSCF